MCVRSHVCVFVCKVQTTYYNTWDVHVDMAVAAAVRLHVHIRVEAETQEQLENKVESHSCGACYREGPCHLACAFGACELRVGYRYNTMRGARKLCCLAASARASR